MTTRRESSPRTNAWSGTSTEAHAGSGLTRRQALGLLVALGVPASALAQDPVRDPVKMLPKSYRVALENDRVRVLEYLSRPGLGVCGRGRHYHPAHVDVILTEIRAKVVEDGKSTDATAKAGDVFWFDAEWHEVENVGKTATRVYMIEIKDTNWKPSTG